MNFKNYAELIKALVNGQKITHVEWKGDFYLYLNSEKGDLCNQADDLRIVSFEVPTDWKIYEPPKQPVVRWLWAYSSAYDSTRAITRHLYSEKELKKSYPSRWFKMVKLEWSRTEFPE